jgi:hypothetical protein
MLDNKHCNDDNESSDNLKAREIRIEFPERDPRKVCWVCWYDVCREEEELFAVGNVEGRRWGLGLIVRCSLVAFEGREFRILFPFTYNEGGFRLCLLKRYVRNTTWDEWEFFSS